VTFPRLIFDAAAAWERRGDGSRLRSSLELAEENMVYVICCVGGQWSTVYGKQYSLVAVHVVDGDGSLITILPPQDFWIFGSFGTAALTPLQFHNI